MVLHDHLGDCAAELASHRGLFSSDDALRLPPSSGQDGPEVERLDGWHRDHPRRDPLGGELLSCSPSSPP